MVSGDLLLVWFWVGRSSKLTQFSVLDQACCCEPGWHSGWRSMFALLVAASGIDVSNPTVTYGPGLTMAPGYINYSDGFIDWCVCDVSNSQQPPLTSDSSVHAVRR